jgi:hypothetical protein
MPENQQNQLELISNVLNVTRDQLSRSMNLNAELEALLSIERKKVSELEQDLEQIKSKPEEKK